MQHKKACHVEKVNVCWNFAAGTCMFGDELCWFTYSKTSQEIKCNNCENVFYSKNNFGTFAQINENICSYK